MAGGLATLWKRSPRDLKAIFVVVFFESWSYFAFVATLMLWVKDDMGFSDEEAGFLYAGWGAAISVCSVFLGSVVDWLLVRRTLMVHLMLGTVCSAMLALLRYKVAVWIILLGPVAATMGVGSSVQGIAIRRYVPEEFQPVAFALRYTVMNVGALAGQASAEGMRLLVTPWLEQRFGISWGLTLFQGFMALLHLMAFFVAAVFVRDVQVASHDRVDSLDQDTVLQTLLEDVLSDASEGEPEPYESEQESELEQPYSPDEDASRPWLMETVKVRVGGERRMVNRVRGRAVFEEVKERARDPYFWKFVLLCFVVVGARSVFRSLDAIYPDFLRRAPFPVSDAEQVPFILLLGINPLMVVCFTTLIGSLVTKHRWHLFWVILFGSLLSAGAPFFMVFVQYWAVVAFLAVLSLGEIIWSPQLDAYAFYFAPVGKEGIFFALATIPTFLSKIFVGVMSGKLLGAYCPDPSIGSCDQGYIIWLIVGGVTVSTPLLLLALTRVLKVENRGKLAAELRASEDSRHERATEGLGEGAL